MRQWWDEIVGTWHWPYIKLPILHNRLHLRTKIPDQHGCGSQYGTMFAHTYRKTQSKGPSLQAINNTTIPTNYTFSLTLNLGLRCISGWVFIIADVSKAILGADFLKHYGLLVDMKSHRLFNPLTPFKVQGIESLVMSFLVLSLLLHQLTLDYEKVLIEFPAITSRYNGNVQIMRNITHHIGTKCPPVCAKPWHFSPRVIKICQAGIPAHIGTRNYQAIIE